MAVIFRSIVASSLNRVEKKYRGPALLDHGNMP
jgi:hypothetical protein